MGEIGVLNTHQPHHSWSSLVLFLHHHLSTTTLSPSTILASHANSSTSPSPLLRDVGSTTNATAPSQARMQPHPPLPFPKGCGRFNLARRRIWRGRTTKGGGQEVRRPCGASRKWAMTNVIARFLPSLPLRLTLTTLNPTDQPQRVDDPNDSGDVDAIRTTATTMTRKPASARAAKTRAPEFHLRREREIEAMLRGWG